MNELLTQWDGPATLLFAALVFWELREFRKSQSRLVELLARQDERQTQQLLQEAGAIPKHQRSRRESYMTRTPAHGIPILPTLKKDEDK